MHSRQMCSLFLQLGEDVADQFNARIGILVGLRWRDLEHDVPPMGHSRAYVETRALEI